MNVNPLWAELRLYNIFQNFMYFSDSIGLNIKKEKKSPLPQRVNVVHLPCDKECLCETSCKQFL